VLSHLIPAEDDAITDDMWAARARTHFGGRVVVAKDLMEL
jgi:ribonuclease BN (tRNA processing enzyme)